MILRDHFAVQAASIDSTEKQRLTIEKFFQANVHGTGPGDVQNLKFSVMDNLHKPLVAACKVVAAGNRIVLQPENQGGSFVEDVRSKRRKRIFERNGVYVLPCWQVLSVSPITRLETNLDVNVAESGLVRADEVAPERVDKCGPTDADVVQETEELKHCPAPILPSKADVESHNVSHLPFRSWCSACVRGRGLSLGHRRVDTKKKKAEQIPTVSVDLGFFGQPEDGAHDTLPVLIVRDRKNKNIWSDPVPSKGVTHPYPARAVMADLDFLGYRRVILRIPALFALCDAVKNGWLGEMYLNHLPSARSRAMERSNVLSKLCTDSRGLSKTSWNNNLELRWNLEVRCWLGWLSIVPIFSNSSTRVSHTMVTQPTCV